MSTHNICFCGKIRKVFTWYPFLSRPMSKYWDRQTWANSVDPDHMPQNAASDQGLHCLPLSPTGVFFVLFLQPKIVGIFLISLDKQMLWYSLEARLPLIFDFKIPTFSWLSPDFSPFSRHFQRPPNSPYSCPQPPNLPIEHLLSENKTII